MAKAAALKAFTKAVTKKKGRPKVDKRKTKAKRKAQSKARQAKFQQSEAAKAEAQGTTKTKLAEKRSIERKAKTIRGKDIDGRTKTLAIRLVEDNPKLTADQAIKKAKNVDKTKIQKVMSMARKDTARMKRKGLLSGLSKEQLKERQRLVTQKLKEMKNEGKERQVIAGRTLSLTPKGEQIIKQKGGIDKILEKPKTYLYQTMNESLPPKGALSKFEGATKAETRKNIKSAFEEMSKPQKLEFIQKRFAPDYTPKQIEDIFYQSKSAVDIRGKSKTQIEGLRNRLKDKGLLPSLGETRRGRGTKQGQALVKEIRKIKKEAQNIRDKDIPKVQTQIDRAQDAIKTAKTTEVKNKLRKNISKLKKEKERLTNLANNYEKGKVTKAKKTLSKMSPQTGSTQSFYTTTKKAGGKVGMYKKGKQIKSGPRGCGAALRGYGKAMKRKK